MCIVKAFKQIFDLCLCLPTNNKILKVTLRFCVPTMALPIQVPRLHQVEEGQQMCQDPRIAQNLSNAQSEPQLAKACKRGSQARITNPDTPRQTVSSGDKTRQKIKGAKEREEESCAGRPDQEGFH